MEAEEGELRSHRAEADPESHRCAGTSTLRPLPSRARPTLMSRTSPFIASAACEGPLSDRAWAWVGAHSPCPSADAWTKLMHVQKN